jgi:DNA-directed RNA polymerase subunit RPC12/RpoP
MSHDDLVTFRCSKCGIKLKAKSDLHGRPFSCPKCKTKVVIPPTAEDAELIEPTVVDGPGADEVQPNLPPSAPVKEAAVGRWSIFFITFLAVVAANLATLVIVGVAFAVLSFRFIDRASDSAAGGTRGIAEALKKLEDSLPEGDANAQAERRKEINELLKVLQESSK